MTTQLDFFESNDEESLNRREIADLRAFVTRSNRAYFRRLGELQKLIVEQDARMDRLVKQMFKEV
jgi:hypothetical protein